MAVPKKKTSTSRRGMRRAHDFIKAPNVGVCSNCGGHVLPHCACSLCNHYNGRNILVSSKQEGE